MQVSYYSRIFANENDAWEIDDRILFPEGDLILSFLQFMLKLADAMKVGFACRNVTLQALPRVALKRKTKNN